MKQDIKRICMYKRKTEMLRVKAWFSLLLMLSTAAPAFSISEPGKIDLLLDRVEKSNLVFIRNGIKYSSTRAREHLEHKLKMAGDRIQTARQFIEHVASRSYLTGIPYYVQYKNGKKVKTGSWLKNQLLQIEKNENR